MEAITTFILEEFMGDAGRTTPERFAEIVVNSQFSVWFIFFFRTSAILGYFLTNLCLIFQFITKLAALWWNFQNHTSSHPQEVAQVNGLENEVSWLKDFLKARDQEIAARD